MPTSTSAIASNLGAAFLVGLLLADSVAGGQTPVLYGASAGTADAEFRAQFSRWRTKMIQARWPVLYASEESLEPYRQISG